MITRWRATARRASLRLVVLGLAVLALVAPAGPASAITIQAGNFEFTLGDVVSVNFFHDRRDVGGYEGFFLTPTVNTVDRSGNFNVDAGQSRISLSAAGPGFMGGRGAGLVAFDFLKSAESGTTQNSLRMFYAWLQNEWASTPFGRVQVRIGQTETPLVSLIPDTVEDTPGFAFGTLYSREAQLRVWHTLGTTTNNLQFAWAISEPNNGVFGTGVNGGCCGDRTGPANRGEVPWFHGQVRLTTNIIGESDLGPAFAAVSGFVGRERFLPAETGLPGAQNIRAWATQIAFNIPIIPVPPGGQPQFGTFGVRAAGHIGENADSYFGGGLQGVAVNGAGTGLDAVQSIGAWVMGRFFLSNKASVYGMGGYEEANHVNVVPAFDSTLGIFVNNALVGGIDTDAKINRELLGGVDFRFTQRLFTAIEYTYKESDFRIAANGTGVNNRVLWSWKYFF